MALIIANNVIEALVHELVLELLLLIHLDHLRMLIWRYVLEWVKPGVVLILQPESHLALHVSRLR